MYMKKKTGIWIDHKKAIIVSLNGEKENIIEIESNIENAVYHDKEGNKGTFSGSHHGNSETKFDERKKNQLNDFLKEVIAKIKETDELYVFGPAETKTKLEQKIYSEKSFDISKLKSVATADSNMSVNQIIAMVKKFYNQ
jgi:hypothetical protein